MVIVLESQEKGCEENTQNDGDDFKALKQLKNN